MALLWDFNVLKKGKWSSEAAYYCPHCHSLRAEDYSEPNWLLFQVKKYETSVADV
jgi:hypothetical protein